MGVKWTGLTYRIVRQFNNKNNPQVRSTKDQNHCKSFCSLYDLSIYSCSHSSIIKNEIALAESECILQGIGSTKTKYQWSDCCSAIWTTPPLLPPVDTCILYENAGPILKCSTSDLPCINGSSNVCNAWVTAIHTVSWLRPGPALPAACIRGVCQHTVISSCFSNK